jgi:hypothetical protein
MREWREDRRERESGGGRDRRRVKESDGAEGERVPHLRGREREWRGPKP